jgi:RNA polymerase sigma-70 factor (ECF subfamily)
MGDTDPLLARATTGDAGAIEELLERYLPDLRGYLARHAGELSQRESVADLAQSVCREVLEHLRAGRLAFQGEPQFKQWLYRAAVMKLGGRRRYWRADARDARAAPPAAPPAASDSRDGHQPFVDPGTPSADAVFHEEIERFARAFAALADEQRQAIALFHLEGLTHAEIAARLGVSESYSRALLSRALARLARLGAARP